jgi:hypothetical protein
VPKSGHFPAPLIRARFVVMLIAPYKTRVEDTSKVPTLVPSEEVSDSIIVDDNRGELIVIDSSDDEIVANARVKSLQNKQHNGHPSWSIGRPRSTSLVRPIACAVYQVAAAVDSDQCLGPLIPSPSLDPFYEGLIKAVREELWNEKYRKGGGSRLCECWETHGIGARVKQRRIQKFLR